MFQQTTALKKIRAMKARKKVIQGGSGAGKTVAILVLLIDRCTKTPNLEVSVVSESVPHLKRGAVKDFKKIMKATGRWSDDHWHDTDKRYSFANGAYIEFFSPESTLGHRRNVLYINECNNISYSDYHQLSIRTSDDQYLDFNPAAEFWVHTEVLTEDDAESIVLTYKDNEARPNNVDAEFAIARRKAEEEQAAGVNGYWTNWVRVYVDGEVGSLMGLVFNNWDQIDEIPDTAKLVAYGLDFGFTNDPTALIGVYKSGNDLFLKELIYEVRLTNSDIINRLARCEVSKHAEIIADSAEPKSIEDISRAGYSMRAAKKGPDSILHSIDKLQRFNLKVTKDSLNLIKELRAYRWITDRAGKTLNEPTDSNNHLLDALRYVALNKLQTGSDTFDYIITCI